MKISQPISVVVILGLVIMLCLGGLSLGGCRKPASTTAPAPTTAPYGELKIGTPTFGAEQFDPAVQPPMMGFYCDGLLSFEDGQVKPGLAERWEIAPDGLSWTFYLRKGVKFHNGDDLTAKDVKFSLDHYMSDAARYGNMKDMVAHTDIVDDYTVHVYTKGPQPYLWTILTSFLSPSYGAIIPKDYIEKNGIKYFEQHPVSSGPYRFVEHVSGVSVTEEAVDNYWGGRLPLRHLSLL